MMQTYTMAALYYTLRGVLHLFEVSIVCSYIIFSQTCLLQISSTQHKILRISQTKALCLWHHVRFMVIKLMSKNLFDMGVIFLAIYTQHTYHGCEYMSVQYRLLYCLLNTVFQGLLFHRFAYASHSPSLAVFYTQPQILDLWDVVLTQRLILLTCVAERLLV